MVAVFFLGAWAGYDIAVWGYCLLRGYDVNLSELSSPVTKYRWPLPPAKPPQIPDTQTWPTPAKVRQAATVAAAAAKPS
jgi:hypothetical protein